MVVKVDIFFVSYQWKFVNAHEPLYWIVDATFYMLISTDCGVACRSHMSLQSWQKLAVVLLCLFANKGGKRKSAV
jgi:hypothetical protein